MTAISRQDLQACVFDAYGTLFDYASAVERCRDRLEPGADRLTELWRRKQLEYTWLRSLMGQYDDFWHVTGEALDYALAVAGRDDPALRAFLMQQYLSLDAYPEVPGLLGALKGAGLRTAILSNGSVSMLTAAVSSARLSALVDATLSVDAVKVYKPHPHVYQLMVDRLGIAKEKILFFSSNGWDAVGAAAFGCRTVWINRGGAVAERLPVPATVEVRSMAEIPALLGL